MGFITVDNVGGIGVNKDLSQVELPNNAWSDVKNIRFSNGSAWSSSGYSQVYNTPVSPICHVLPIRVEQYRYWICCSATKIYIAVESGGLSNYTPQTVGVDWVLTGGPNTWTSALLGGVPVVNTGGNTPPMSVDLFAGVLNNLFTALPNWPSGVTCKSMRAYKNFLVALNVTKPGGHYPYMVKWSHPADPGTTPISWDETDPTMDAGETALSEGYDPIVDGMQLRDTFMIYRESSVWRMDFTGGAYVFKFSKVLGTSGIMAKNCAVEVDGWHFVLTGSDVIMHDGVTATSVLDRQTRRFLFANIDVDNNALCFVFKHPFLNEVYVCYTQAGSTACDKAMVWNYVDKTVSFRDLPNLLHAAYGPIPSGMTSTWALDSDPWGADITTWSSPDFGPERARVLMAGNAPALYMLDGSNAQGGAQVDCYLERRGLTLNAPEAMKLVRAIRPRIYSQAGGTINIQVGGQDDPWSEPKWCAPVPFNIGSSVKSDMLVSGRYIAIKFSVGTAFQWRLDSYDIDVETMGAW